MTEYKADLLRWRDAIFEEIAKYEEKVESSTRYDDDYEAGYLDAFASAKGIINSATEEMTE